MITCELPLMKAGHILILSRP